MEQKRVMNGESVATPEPLRERGTTRKSSYMEEAHTNLPKYQQEKMRIKQKLFEYFTNILSLSPQQSCWGRRSGFSDEILNIQRLF